MPSVNLMFGLILTVHSLLSAFGVTDSAVRISYFCVAGSQRVNVSYNTIIGIPPDVP